MRFALDHNHLCKLEVTKEGGVWRASLVRPEGVFPPFTSKLGNVVTVEDMSGEQYSLAGGESTHVPGGDALKVLVDGHLFGTIEQQADGTLTATHSDYLTVTETRMMGELPRASGVFPSRGAGQAKDAIFTDFHTHSSSEISGQGLVALALKMGVRYPVRLLSKLGISTEGLATAMIDRVRFPPLEPPSVEIPKQEEGVSLADLSKAHRKKLANAMNMPADRQSTAGAFDLVCYPFRYPFTKHPQILEESYREIGRQYARNGVHYAEITISSPVNADLLKMLHRVVPEIEKETGVSLRFLAGIPRSYGKQDLHDSLEKAKILAKSPYVVGIDIIGYETNKSSEFDEELRGFANWAKQNDPEFTLRVHAGENMKNPDNIRHILDIAKDSGVRIRVGHAIYGVDENTLSLARELARKGQLVLEFNPDSNIALNNIDSIRAIPFRECVLGNIPFVVGSDGSGFYQTSARQLEKDLEHLELDGAALDLLKQSQNDLMNRQFRYSRDKEYKLRHEYLDFGENAEARERFAEGLVAAYAGIPPAPPSPVRETANGILPKGVISLEGDELPDKLKGKHPVLLVGASGSTWTSIPANEQREAAITVDMLTRALDPKEVFFVTGRVKKEGLAAKLYEANDRLKSSEEPGFDIAALHENNFLKLPQRLANFSTIHGGELIAMGGGAFTRDIILEVKHKNILADVTAAEGGSPNKAHYYVMSNISGASREKAEMLTRKYQADDAVGLLRVMAKQHPDWFRPEFREHGLDKETAVRLYKEAASCVDGKENSFSHTGALMERSCSMPELLR